MRASLATLPGPAGAAVFSADQFSGQPFAAGGSGFFGGFIDYMRLINERDGGVNGVKLTWTDPETEWNVERGVSVRAHEGRPQEQAPASVLEPVFIGILYALLSAPPPTIPLITINHTAAPSTHRWPGVSVYFPLAG